MYSGMISLVNSVRLSKGKSSLGWINPTLYKYSKIIILNDIVSGNNRCFSTGNGCCTQGFYASNGWDPATGNI